MRKLAKELGLSDVGLAKLCKRHQIPRPGRGYWQRIQMGRNPLRVPLPALEESNLEVIEITVQERLVPDQDSVRKITVLADQPITHPLVLRTRKLLSRANANRDERGLLIPKSGRVSHVQVSAAALPRALQILDALFRALEEEGYILSWPEGDAAELTVRAQEEMLGLTISEVVEAKLGTPTNPGTVQQKGSWWLSRPRPEYQPTGRLALTVEGAGFLNIRRKWSDGKKQRVEECLGKFLAGASLAVRLLKKQREERLRLEREWEERRRRQEEERRRQAEYERKAQVVRKLANAWRESELVREFLKAFLSACQEQVLSGERQQEAQALVEWATNHANSVDPLTRIPGTLDEFKGMKCVQPAGWGVHSVGSGEFTNFG